MAYYITYGELQRHLKEYAERTGRRMQFPEMTDYLYRKGILSDTRPKDIPVHKMFREMSDEEFEKIMDAMILTLTPNLQMSPHVTEATIIPMERDVFIIRHPRYTRSISHYHNYFEINFVASGSCTFHFEGESRILSEGEFCILAPGSQHSLMINDESTIFNIMIRKSTFNTSFFSVMLQKDLLAHFFRTILQGDSHPNYLLFFIRDSAHIKTIIHNAMGECYKRDPYSNSNCISWITLLFSALLRSYGQTLQFYNYQMGADFSLVLQYVQHNYKTLTLSELAKFFNYSKPYLCTLFKQNTGYSFTDLITQLRMSDAVSLLTNTNLKIGEIAEKIGYNSSDHFTRIFRSIYKMSPKEYRKAYSAADNAFIPFVY